MLSRSRFKRIWLYRIFLLHSSLLGNTLRNWCPHHYRFIQRETGNARISDHCLGWTWIHDHRLQCSLFRLFSNASPLYFLLPSSCLPSLPPLLPRSRCMTSWSWSFIWIARCLLWTTSSRDGYESSKPKGKYRDCWLLYGLPNASSPQVSLLFVFSRRLERSEKCHHSVVPVKVHGDHGHDLSVFIWRGRWENECQRDHDDRVYGSF